MSPQALERQRRRFDIVDEVKPLSGEAVLRKSSPSAFWGTPLAGHLNFLQSIPLLPAVRVPVDVCGQRWSMGAPIASV